MKHQGTQNRALANDALYRDVPGGGAVGVVQHGQVHISLADIQGEVSGVPFAIAGLVANTKLLAIEVDIVQDLAGTGPMSAAHLEIGSSVDVAPDSVMGSTNVFTGAALGFVTTAGSNPYQSRGGQSLEAIITTLGGTLANATAGDLVVHFYYVVEP